MPHPLPPALDADWELVGQLSEADRALARYYGLTDEELNFIINYDIKYPMRKEGKEREE